MCKLQHAKGKMCLAMCILQLSYLQCMVLLKVSWMTGGEGECSLEESVCFDIT